MIHAPVLKHFKEMGVRGKVTITLVIIALTQTACRHCIPGTTRKASLKRYLNDLKPVIDVPVPPPYSLSRVNKTPKQTFGKTKAKNARISQNSFPKKSMYETYNFPRNEYPHDASRANYQVTTPQKDFRNLQSSVINNLKKEIKMNRKLLSNRRVNNKNSQSKREMSSVKFAPTSDSIRLLDSEKFPEVQYPLNIMETWVPNYWNYLPFIEDKQFDEFGHQTFNPKVKENIKKPQFPRLTKTTANQFLKSYDKLKEEHRRSSTECSKRSDVGQKGLNFTKTATCERTSEDLITAGMISSIPGNSTDTTKTLRSSSEITLSSKNTCPVTEYADIYHQVPIPYKVIKENTKNICQVNEQKNNPKELEDMDNSVIAQTLQLIQGILFIDDTTLKVPPVNFSKEIKKYMNISDYINAPENEDIPTTLMDSANSCVFSPSEVLSQAVSDGALAAISQNNKPSLPTEIENTTTVAGAFNVRMPLPATEPAYKVFSKPAVFVPSPIPINMEPISNGNAASSSTSVIIIPINNNAVGKSQSHMFETTPDSPIVVYIPSTQSSGIRSQTLPFDQYASSSLDETMPNNKLYNVLSNMAPLQNDNPSSITLVNELLNGISNNESSLPMYETLPTNSMCYNNENRPSLTREKLFSNDPIHKSSTDTAPSATPTCDEKLFSNQSTESCRFDMNADSLPQTSDYEHPLFNFAGSSLSHQPYNNVITNELPIFAHEINFDITNVSSKDLFIPKHNIIIERHKNVSDHNLQINISEAVAAAALDSNFTLETPTEILDNHTFTPTSEKPTGSVLSLMDKTIPPSPDSEILPLPMNMPMTTSKAPNDSLPLPLDKVLLPVPVTLSPIDSFREQVQKALPPTPFDGNPTINFSSPMDKSLFPNSLYSNDFPLLSMDETLLQTPPYIDFTNDLAMHADKIPSPPSEVLVNDNSNITNELPLPLEEVLESITSAVPTDGVAIPIGVSSDEMPESLPPVGSPPQNRRLPLSIDKRITDFSLSDTLTKDPILIDNSTLSVNDNIEEIPYSTHTIHNQYSSTLLVDDSLSPEDDECMDTLVSDTPNAKSVSLNKDLRTTNPDKTNDEALSDSTLSDIARDDLSLPMDMKLSLPKDKPADLSLPTNKTPSTSTLSITKALLENVLSEIITEGFSSPVKPLLVTPSSLLDNTFYFIDVESPIFESAPQSVDKVLPYMALTENPKDNLFVDKEHSETPILDIPTELPLSINEMYKSKSDILTGDTKDQAKNETQSSDKPAVDPQLPTNKIPLPKVTSSGNSLPRNKTLPSKLPITKALLENVMSDINITGFLSPVAKTLPVTSPSVLDKTLYYLESPLSGITRDTRDDPQLPTDKILSKTLRSYHPTDSLSFREKTDHTLPLAVDKMLANISNLDIPIELPSPMDKIHKDKSDIQTVKVEYEDISETPPSCPDNPSDDILPQVDKRLSPTDVMPNDSPIPPTKPQLISRIPVTRALLEKVLSDIIDGGFAAEDLLFTPLSK